MLSQHPVVSMLHSENEKCDAPHTGTTPECLWVPCHSVADVASHLLGSHIIRSIVGRMSV